MFFKLAWQFICEYKVWFFSFFLLKIDIFPVQYILIIVPLLQFLQDVSFGNKKCPAGAPAPQLFADPI